MSDSLSFEDTWQDVVAKAMRGLAMPPTQLAERAQITQHDADRLQSGEFSPALIAAVAGPLGLNGEALLALAVGEPGPPAPPMPACFFRSYTPYHDMTVNAYLAWDAETREGIIFDSGADASDLLAQVRELGLSIRHVLLTHTHGDHIFDLDRIVEKTGATAHTPAAEPLAGALPVEPGAVFSCGALRIEARRTSGHAVGGTSYVVNGLEVPLAVVGDALFARSMGGPQISYADCLSTNRAAIFTLPDATVLAPGHGPLTTVGTEKRWNPFFPHGV